MNTGIIHNIVDQSISIDESIYNKVKRVENTIIGVKKDKTEHTLIACHNVEDATCLMADFFKFGKVHYDVLNQFNLERIIHERLTHTTPRMPA